MKIAIIHYDLSMRTGAQRLVLGMGNAMKELGHDIAYFTSIYDKNKAFTEFKKENLISFNGKRDFFGKFRGLTAYRESRKMIEKCRKEFNPDLYIFSSNYYLASEYNPSMIYCHHPEQLLVNNGDIIRKILHVPIDRAEKKGFQKTDRILCNSQFTSNVIKRTFQRSSTILFPGVDTERFSFSNIEENFILTVNRIMPGKNLEFAIDIMNNITKSRKDIKLIIAGTKQIGFEWYIQSLENKIRELKLEKFIEIKIDVSDKSLIELYKKCIIFLYTPIEEHFGIAPIEAMSCGKPAIAFSKGGPKETIQHEKTGYVLEDNITLWEKKIINLLEDKEKRTNMGIMARERVVNNFSWDVFTKKLEKCLQELSN